MPIREYRRLGSDFVAYALGAVGTIPIADGFIYGLTKPTASLTGFAASGVTESQLTHYSGDIDLANLTNPLTRTWVHGRIYGRPTSSSVKIRDCYVDGGSTPINGGLIDCTRSGTATVVVERTKVRPQVSMQQSNGFQGHDYTADRCDVSGTVDGFRVHNTSAQGQPSGVRIWGSYGHDLAYYVPDSQSDNQTHNDVIQLEGGTGLDVWGSWLDGYGDPTRGQINTPGSMVNGKAQDGNPKYPARQILSCLIVTPSAAGGGSVNGWRLRQCWLTGAQVKLNVAEKALGTQTGIDVSGNRFGRDGYFSNPTLIDNATLQANQSSWSNNVWTNDSTAITYNAR